MSETFRTTPPDQQWSGSNAGANGYQGHFGGEPEQTGENEVGKALLVGLLGGLVSAAGYFVYQRLPEEQKDRLNQQVRGLVAQRITELRQNFNI
jgi:hypothetical protein